MNPEEIAALAQKSKEMKMALEHLKSLSRDQAARFQDEAGAGRAQKQEAGAGRAQKQEAQEKFYRDFVASKATAAQRSMKEGREKGLREGLQKGMEKGMEKGRRQVALSMLQENADRDFISKVTGLSAEEIERLKNNP